MSQDNTNNPDSTKNATKLNDLKYNNELFSITADAATLPQDQAHPAFTGTTAGNIHSDTELRPKGWAEEQNAKLLDIDPTATPQYGVELLNGVFNSNSTISLNA